MFKKYVALDVGDVRIGVAKSDIMGILATPLEVIDRRKVKAVKRIEEILIQENTKSLVIGIPKSLDGTEKRQAEKVREFIEKLNKSIEGLEIFEVDERLTTVSADRLLNETNKKGAYFLNIFTPYNKVFRVSLTLATASSILEASFPPA